MYQVIEFNEASGGGISIVRREWLTPRKKECFWPNEKKISHFNKLLNDVRIPPDNWKLCAVSKVFYATDDLLKARQKLKQAENETDICSTDTDDRKKRKRKPCSKLDFSSSDESSDQIYKTSRPSKSIDLDLPLPPTRVFESQLGSFESKSRGTPSPSITPKEHRNITNSSTVLENRANSSVFNCESQFDSSICTPPRTTEIVTQSEPSTASVQQICSPSTGGTNVDAIARILAQFNERLKSIESVQKEILEKLTPAQADNVISMVPIDVNLPCNTVQEVEELDLWLNDKDNSSTLTKHLSLVGGKKAPNVIRRILERLFTNEVAILFNWTGKNKKRPLKDLTIMKLLPDLVRRNKNMQAVSDDDVFSITTQWFRFTKDREGGREKRRPNAGQ